MYPHVSYLAIIRLHCVSYLYKCSGVLNVGAMFRGIECRRNLQGYWMQAQCSRLLNAGAMLRGIECRRNDQGYWMQAQCSGVLNAGALLVILLVKQRDIEMFLILHRRKDRRVEFEHLPVNHSLTSLHQRRDRLKDSTLLFFFIPSWNIKCFTWYQHGGHLARIACSSTATIVI